MRVSAIALATVALVATVHARQAPALTVVSVSPSGEITQREDANQIRVVFSEPMIALGNNPDAQPSWFHVTPAIDGAYRWSGTSILILTPNPAKPLPLATKFTVTIDRAAASTSGRSLAAPYTGSFTTPTVKLVNAPMERQNRRFDSPVLLYLFFNQPVRPADVLAHTTLRHANDEPFVEEGLTAEARARLAQTDAAGLARYDAKVAMARATAASTAPVGLRLAADWDRKRFKERPEMVVLETTAVPEAGARLRVTIDARVPSPAGTATPGEPQASTSQIERPLFVLGLQCHDGCQPSGWNPVSFSGSVLTQSFARAVTVRDVTTPAREIAVTPSAVPASGSTDADDSIALESAGFARQPGMSQWLVRVDPSVAAADGQTLGYPWVGFIRTGRDNVFTSFGDGHGVWEKGSGPQLPFHARNLRAVQQWLAPVSPSDLMSRLRALTIANFSAAPPGAGTRRTLNVTPDAVQSYGVDLSSVLTNGTGLAWAALKPVDGITGAKIPGDRPATTSTIVQVTNIGLTVKDSPGSTLVFATRLDNGQAEPDVNVSLVDLDNKTLWKGRTNKDGVAMAPALSPRSRLKGLEERLRYSEFRFIVIGEKNGDVAYVGSDWNEGISPWEFGLNYAPSAGGDVVR
jgi:hypothetical protein